MSNAHIRPDHDSGVVAAVRNMPVAEVELIYTGVNPEDHAADGTMLKRVFGEEHVTVSGLVVGTGMPKIEISGAALTMKNLDELSKVVRDATSTASATRVDGSPRDPIAEALARRQGGGAGRTTGAGLILPDGKGGFSR